MSTKIIILPFAELDIKSSVEFYFEEEPNLDKKFITALHSTFTLISKSPTVYPTEKYKIRKAVVKTFPFCVYYIYQSTIIYVFAVFHDKRNPKIWKQRGLETGKKRKKI